METGMKIKLKRISKGIKQKDFADKMGIAKEYLCQIESGKKIPGLTLLSKICKELNISLTIN